MQLMCTSLSLAIKYAVFNWESIGVINWALIGVINLDLTGVINWDLIVVINWDLIGVIISVIDRSIYENLWLDLSIKQPLLNFCIRTASESANIKLMEYPT